MYAEDVPQKYLSRTFYHLNLTGCQFGYSEDKGKLSVCGRFDTAHRLCCTQQGIPRKANRTKAGNNNLYSHAIVNYHNDNRSKDSTARSRSSNSSCATKGVEL
jgi:hypothetical protein